MKTIVFLCFTPYHLIHSVYYGMKLKGVAKRILVWQNFTEYKIDMQRFQDAFDDCCHIKNFYKERFLSRQYHKCLYAGWLYTFSPLKKLLSQSLINSTVLCLFSDQHIISRKVLMALGKRALDVVLIEEGFATYLIQSTKIKKTRDWFINGILGAHYEPYIGSNKRIKTIFCKHPEKMPVEKCEGRRIIRENNIFLDSMWKSIFEDILDCAIQKNEVREKVVLWLGQPVEQVGISIDEQIEWIRKMRRFLPEEYTVVIKLHPRENKEKYNCLDEDRSIKVLQLGENAWIPVEFLLSYIRPEVVASIYTSAANSVIELGLESIVVFCYQAFRFLEGKDDVIKAIVGENVHAYNLKNVDEIAMVLDKYKGKKTNKSIVNEDYDIGYLKNILT